MKSDTELFIELVNLKRLIKQVVTQKFDDLCWLDVYKQLGEAVGIKFDPLLLPQGQFLSNCSHFHECLTKGIDYKSRKPLVIIESPYAGDVEKNETYARACVRDSLLRGESPFASHLLYTQPGILDDKIPEERRHGINAGFMFRHAAQMTVAYMDLGESSGMRKGFNHSAEIGCPVVTRFLGPPWSTHLQTT
jgi:hypothetical protein